MKKWIAPLLFVAAAGLVGLAGTVVGWENALAAISRMSNEASRPRPRLNPADSQQQQQPASAWDNTIRLDDRQIEALGVTLAEVKPQTAPTILEINGTTAYDTRTLTTIRSRFNCLVNHVFVSIGDEVNKGDPLLDLFSTDLAEAKALYEERTAQWQHDRAQLDRYEPLFQQKAVAAKEYYDAVNDEKKSQLLLNVARDNLGVFGLSEADIAQVEHEEGSRKAMLTLHAPAGGLVINRDVVEGSLYDPSDRLMVIAPPDRLWVLGNVYESDQDKVHVGQPWEIRFPFLSDVITAKIEHVDARVNPTTKTVQIRTSIDNPQGRFKADMLVRGQVAIPPVEGRTVVPRQAVVFQDDGAFVFVRDPADPRRFTRHSVEVAQESHDQVIIAHGLEPGALVVVRSSVILAQMYEDLAISEHGLPL